MTAERQVFNANNGVTEGVWRDGGVITKRLRRSAGLVDPSWVPSDNPSNWLYWRREAFAYETALPERLGLLGPTLISSAPTDAGVELTVDAFVGRTAAELEVADLEELATAVGRSQGRAELPTDPWLSRGFLRDYAGSRVADFGVYDIEAAWAGVADDTRNDLRELHRNRDRLFAIMEALPRTVCHLDLFPNNVFATADGVGLIDWSFSGDGAIGEDVGNLIPDSVFDLQLAASELPVLEDRLPRAYLAGLRLAGWSGDDRLVMLGIHASAVKYDWLAPRVMAKTLANAGIDGYGGVAVDPAEMLTARWAGLALVGRWAREALSEADRLRL
jgi:hypothetical protein